MNRTHDPLQDLSEIREMMERSSKFLSLSGLAGVGAGVAALTGALLASLRLGSGDPESPAGFLLLDAGGVLLAALTLSIFFTTRMARKKNLPVWDHTTVHLLTGLTIPLLVGGASCLLLWYHGFTLIIPSVTLIFYGLALLNTSTRTLNEVRYLAAAELLLGLLAMGFLNAWLLFWALGFGVLHLVYGIAMYLKYEK